MVARVDFHSQVGDKLPYCCRLVRKVLSLSESEGPMKQVVISGSLKTLETLDELLWSFSAEEFLPHCFIDEESAPFCPVVLASDDAIELLEGVPHADVFIHLGQEFLPNIEAIAARFDRVVEIVSMEDSDLLAGRERFKQYRQMGVELHNHDQKGAK